MATATIPRPWTFAPGQRFVLEEVSWAFYEALLEELGDRHIRVSYDDGVLQLMSPTERHERYAELAGRLVAQMAFELRWPLVSGGSTTFRRKDRRKGLEPDRCFWLTNAPLIKAKTKLDLAVDPPPDLAIEVDITSSSLGRMGIYAGLGIPEIWRYDGDKLRVYILQPTGSYAVQSTSLSFPFLPMEAFAEFVLRGLHSDETEWLQEFLDWFRTEVRPRGAADGDR